VRLGTLVSNRFRHALEVSRGWGSGKRQEETMKIRLLFTLAGLAMAMSASWDLSADISFWKFKAERIQTSKNF
jgi:hypothetical protein